LVERELITKADAPIGNLKAMAVSGSY
jgi:hypothetical protein